jgi:hypothetical protein
MKHHRHPIKPLAALFALTLAAAHAVGPYYTEDGRILSGMSYDKPNPAAVAPLVIVMEGLDPASARFGKILDQVRLRRPSLSAQDFVARLRRGEVFSVDVPVKQAVCRSCNGCGKINDPKAKSADRKSPCPVCKNTGKTPATRKCLIRWSKPKT